MFTARFHGASGQDGKTVEILLDVFPVENDEVLQQGMDLMNKVCGNGSIHFNVYSTHSGLILRIPIHSISYQLELSS